MSGDQNVTRFLPAIEKVGVVIDYQDTLAHPCARTGAGIA
jgi:hypothetical protein